MKEIFSILKKYIFIIIIMIGMIILQAMCDLKLPDYTSNIVNVGIQQNGIETTNMEAIRSNEVQDLKLFMSLDEQKIFDNSYTLIKKGDKRYLKKYKILEKEDLYVQNEDADEEKVADILVVPLAIKASLGNLSIEAFPEYANIAATIDVTSEAKALDIIPLLPEDIKNKIVDGIVNKFSSIDENMQKQSAIEYIKSEYKTIGISLEDLQNNYIKETGLKMLGVSLVTMVIIVITIFASSRMASSFSKELRSKIVSKVLKFSNKEFEDFSSSSLITRSTNDIQQIQMLIVMGFRIIIYAPIIGIGAFLKVSQNEMGWVIGVAVLLIFVIVGTLFTIALPKFQKLQDLIDKLNLVFREILNGLPVIRAFSNEKYEEKRFDKANTDLTRVNKFVNNTMVTMMPLMSFVMNGVCVLIIWVGAEKVNTGAVQVGNLIAFMTYAIQIIMSFLMISILSIMIPRAFISLKRIKEIFNTESSITELDNPEKFKKDQQGIVEFKDVYFRYPDAAEDVIQNINFVARPGETTAFIGSTGSGKSTLINLIPRFFDVTSGKILVDGVDIKNCKLKDLRAKIGFVPQKGLLFSGTIESNINFGNSKSLSKKALEECASISQAKEFIDEKPDGFNSEISQGGTNISGGQRQRLAIARALAIDPEIYIFDDSFSALDFKTDAKLRKELAKKTKNKTVIIVAQRISTIMNADQIIVLNEGEIVGIGKHKDLLKDCDIYKEIVYSQLGKEEV